MQISNLCRYCHVSTLKTIVIIMYVNKIVSHFCGNNRIPYGIEIHKNGQPTLLCSRPSCFEKLYAECDERAIRNSCTYKNSWIGGIDKSLGKYLPLYVQCCEFEALDEISEPLYSNVTIHAGEYFEGEEIMDKNDEEMIAFDLITNIHMVPKFNSSAYIIDIRRLYCHRLSRPRRYKKWKWP